MCLAEGETLRYECESFTYNPMILPWQSVKHAVLAIAKQNFAPHLWPEEDYERDFVDPDCVAILAWHKVTNAIVGYSYATPLMKYPEEHAYPVIELEDCGQQTAYLWSIALEKSYQGHGLIADIMQMQENELKRRGYRHMELNATGQKFAVNLQKTYTGRLLAAVPLIDPDYGEQVFFRIRL